MGGIVFFTSCAFSELVRMLCYQKIVDFSFYSYFPIPRALQGKIIVVTSIANKPDPSLYKKGTPITPLSYLPSPSFLLTLYR